MLTAPVQMFEMVVHTPPAGRPPRRAASIIEAPDDEDSLERAKDDDPDGTRRDAPRLVSPTGKIYRGAFVLRPTADASGQPPASDTPDSWTLWWQPLPPAREDGNPPSAAEIAGYALPIEVASDIAYLRWQVFDDRVRKQDYAGVWRLDLPAYVEVELATTAGLWANWMFEVDWVDGSEGAAATAGDEALNEQASEGDSSSQPAGTTKIVPLKPSP
jgi:hypothetical protein